MKRFFLICLIALWPVTSAFAWGERGHFIVTEAATHGLPTDMPQFFYAAFPV